MASALRDPWVSISQIQGRDNEGLEAEVKQWTRRWDVT